MTNIFQVPRRAVRVRVRLYGGHLIEGDMYAAAAGPSGRPGMISDRLNDPDELFLPLAGEDGGCLLNKARILSVECVGAPDEAQHFANDGGQRHSVRMGLADGETLQGELPFTMPPGKERLVDYLNEAPAFLPLVGDGELTLINREFVIQIADLDRE